MRFDPETKRMRLDALQAGVTIDQVRAETGFDLPAAPQLTALPTPTAEELRILRTLDPDRLFLG